MVKPGKLRTRKSTLGATREERISSKQTVGSKSVYGSAKRKGYRRQESDPNRVGGIRVEQRQDPVPRSITTTGLDDTNGNTACTSSHNNSNRRDPPPPSDCADGNLQQPRSKSRSMSTPKTFMGRKQDVKQSRKTESNTTKAYIDRIEVMPMKDNENQPFVRIMVGRELLKPRDEEIAKKVATVVPQNGVKEEGNKQQSLSSSIIDTTTLQLCGHSTRYTPPKVKTVDASKLTLCGMSSRSAPPPSVRSFDKTKLGLHGHFTKYKGQTVKGIDMTKLELCGNQARYAPATSRNIDTTKLDLFRNLDQLGSAINVLESCAFVSSSCMKSERQRKDNTMNVLFDHIGRSLGESNKITQSHSLRIEETAAKSGNRIDRANITRNIPAQNKLASKTRIPSLGITGRGKEKKKNIKYSNEEQRDQCVYFPEENQKDQLVSREYWNSAARNNMRFCHSKYYEDNSDDSWTSSSNESDSDSDSDSSHGIIEKMMASLSNKDKGVPNTVSFISDTDESYVMEVRDDDVYMIGNESSEDLISKDSTVFAEAIKPKQRESIVGVVFGIGSAFGLAKKKKKPDIRDLRIIDSDISSSSSEGNYDSNAYDAFSL